MDEKEGILFRIYLLRDIGIHSYYINKKFQREYSSKLNKFIKEIKESF